MVETLFVAIMASHVVLILVLTFAWRNHSPKFDAPNSYLVSVVIPVRNEASNIVNLLRDLVKQKTKNHFEVIVVDDESEDDTVKEVSDFIKESDQPIRLLRPSVSGNHALTPKKRALNTGIGDARGEIIVTTDGDCRAPDTWLQSVADQFSDENVQFVAGPVSFNGSAKIFENIQAMEFAGLIGVGASSISLGYPNICNGANLAFRKKAFKKLNGYNGNHHLASGDDEFLLQKFAGLDQRGIRFLKDQRAIITTNAKKNWAEFYHQRKRWTSKLKHHKELHIKLLSGWFFMVNLMVVIALGLSLFQLMDWRIFGALFMVKMVTEAIFVSQVVRFLRSKMSWLNFLLLELFHPFYVVLMGLFTNFGTFKWKGRIYNE